MKKLLGLFLDTASNVPDGYKFRLVLLYLLYFNWLYLIRKQFLFIFLAVDRCDDSEMFKILNLFSLLDFNYLIYKKIYCYDIFKKINQLHNIKQIE